MGAPPPAILAKINLQSLKHNDNYINMQPSIKKNSVYLCLCFKTSVGG
jgi:hypothetical protein